MSNTDRIIALTSALHAMQTNKFAEVYNENIEMIEEMIKEIQIIMNKEWGDLFGK